MGRTPIVCASALVLSAAIASNAQYKFELRFVTNNTGAPNADIPNGPLNGVIDITGATTGNFDIILQGRIVYDDGVTGQGVASWQGDVLVNGLGDSGEPAFLGGGLIAPYNNLASGGTAVDDDVFDIAGVVPILDQVVWPQGGPEPTQPSWAGTTGGPNGWVDIASLAFEILDTTTPRDIVFETDSFEGRALDEQGWIVTDSVPPTFGDGSVTFSPSALPNPDASPVIDDTVVETGFTLRVIPAPGSAALLCIGGLMAGRRRR